jgi:hypothetical protein
MPETIGIEENELHRRNLENKADEQNQHVKKTSFAKESAIVFSLWLILNKAA